MRLTAFKEMLRQMSIHLKLSEVVKVILVIYNVPHYGFLLYMENGEYWWVINKVYENDPNYVLFKYPPPIPAITELRPLPVDTAQMAWYPPDLNDFLRDSGSSGDTLFLAQKGDDDARNNQG
jgi:hypothetical protein